jgi:membrane protein YdbS with pleckstrin-like domain
MKIGETLKGMAYVTRFPSTDKQSRIFTTAWAVSMVCAVASIVSHLMLRQTGSWVLWAVAALLVLDVYMLRLCIQGIRYRRARRGRVRRRA